VQTALASEGRDLLDHNEVFPIP